MTARRSHETSLLTATVLKPRYRRTAFAGLFSLALLTACADDDLDGDDGGTGSDDGLSTQTGTETGTDTGFETGGVEVGAEASTEESGGIDPIIDFPSDFGEPTPELVAALQAVLDTGPMDPGIPAASLSISGPDYGNWSGAGGLASLPKATALQPKSHFRAGSVMKSFLSVAILKRIEAGDLVLDARLPNLIAPEDAALIPGAEQITLRMLLNHSSGLPEWVDDETDASTLQNPGYQWTPQAAMKSAFEHPLQGQPGEKYAYSNTNYTILGLVIDRLPNSPGWRQEVRNTIIEPLQLANTFLPESGDLSLPEPHARGYHILETGPIDVTEIDPSMAGAAGGHALVTTTADLTRFTRALAGGYLFSQPGTLNMMMTWIPDLEMSDGIPLEYGLGLMKYELPGGPTVIGHIGSTAGYATMMFYVPDFDLAITTNATTTAVMSNYSRCS